MTLSERYEKLADTMPVNHWREMLYFGAEAIEICERLFCEINIEQACGECGICKLHRQLEQWLEHSRSRDE